MCRERATKWIRARASLVHTMVPPFYVDCLLGDPGKKEEEEVVGFSREGLQRATRG